MNHLLTFRSTEDTSGDVVTSVIRRFDTLRGITHSRLSSFAMNGIGNENSHL